MKSVALLCAAVVIALPSIAFGESVILDTFNGRYYPPGTGPGGPQEDYATAQDTSSQWHELWDWVFWGYGPPLYCEQETGIKLAPHDYPPDSGPNPDPPNASASERINLPYIGEEDSGIQAYCIGEFLGPGTDIAQALATLGAPEIDWRQPVRIEADVFGHNTGSNLWQQRIDLSGFEGTFTAHPVNWGQGGPNQEWQVTYTDLVPNDPDNPDTVFNIYLVVDFTEGGPPEGLVNAALWENLRIVYTPVGPPTVATVDPDRGATITELPQVSVTFSEEVTGVTANDLTVNGSPATSVAGSGAGPYVFSGYAAPGLGTVTVELAADPPSGIQDLDGNSFEGDSWTYEMVPPPDICDFNEDGDVDSDDLTILNDCYSGPGGGTSGESGGIPCTRCDVDDDNDVDLVDFATFQGHYTG